MRSLQNIIMVAIAAAGFSPIDKLVDAVIQQLVALVTPALVRRHAKALKRGRPRISIAAPPTKSCLADDPDVDRALLGFCLNRQGLEVIPKRWLTLMRAARNVSGWYWSRTTRGRSRRVKCRALHALLITHCPWHSGYLLANVTPSDPWWRLIAIDLLHEFRRLTGYRVVGIACHRGEGCVHWHIVFSTVLRGHRRHDLRGMTGPGRRGLGCIGIAQVATLRRGYAGLEPRRAWLYARLRIAALTRKRGAAPIDWSLSQWLDARVLDDFPKAPAPTCGEDDDPENDHAASPANNRIHDLSTRRRDLRRLIKEKQKRKE